MESKYLSIKNYLVNIIKNGKQGDKLPTEKELCKTFEASRIPVRRAMEILEKEGIIFRKKAKGTFVKEKNNKKKDLQFIVVLPTGRKEGDYYFIINGIISYAQKKGMSVTILPFSGEKEELVGKIEEIKHDGLIWVAPFDNEYKILEELREKGKPILIANRVIKNSHFNFISTDHEEGARKITEYLLGKGRKKIVFAALVHNESHCLQRFDGFKKALFANGIAFQTEQVIEISHEEYLSRDFQNFRKKFVFMLEKFSPDAIFISGNFFIAETLNILKKRSIRIPEDLEVATFDEVPVEFEEKKSIHEVIQPLFDLGHKSGEEMEKLVKGETGKVRIILPPFILL